MTAAQICERLDRIERAEFHDIRSDIAALRLDIEIDVRRADDAKRAAQAPAQEKHVA